MSSMMVLMMRVAKKEIFRSHYRPLLHYHFPHSLFS
jgi:hypothetical protein